LRVAAGAVANGSQKLVKAKIDVPGNVPIDLSEERKQELNRQLEGQLEPVLRPSDFDSFNLKEAFELVRNATEALAL
jgi:hypothetical protein